MKSSCGILFCGSTPVANIVVLILNVIHVSTQTSLLPFHTYVLADDQGSFDLYGIVPVMRDEAKNHAPLAEWDDADLVEAMATGDTDAMAELYDRFSRPVFSFALRILEDRHHAEELLQEVFFRAWRQGDKFSARRGSFISWLLSITHNMAIDEIRKRNRRPKRADSDDPVLLMDSLVDDGPTVEDQAVQATIRAHIRTAMDSLPEPQRTAIDLAYFQGLTQREIAHMQGEPLGTIKTRLRLGVRKLREHLADQGVDTL